LTSAAQRLGLLTRHAPTSLVCFAVVGDRDAGQLAAYARAIAASLPDAPAEPGVRPRVVLACTDRYHFSAALAAVWLRGFTAVLPENGQPATVQRAAAAPHVVALLHDRDESLGLDVRTLERPDTRGALPLWLPDNAEALIAYTSGSTGQPSPHEKTLAQLLSEPEAHVRQFALAGLRIVAAVPPYHIYGLLFGVLVPLLAGGSMARAAPLQPAALLRELGRARADVLVCVPPQLAALVADREDGHEPAREDVEAEASWPKLQRVFSSAGPLAAITAHALARHGWPVSEILGSTETGGMAQRSGADTSWRALPHVRLSIAEDGTLLVDSPWLSPTGPRPLATADRVERADDGGFHHLGRRDAVVKVGGRRIDTGGLEARLRDVPGVRDARVLARDSTRLRGVELLAVVEADDVSADTLRAALRQHVDPVALPRRYRVVARLPRSETGKVTQAALLALFGASPLRSPPRARACTLHAPDRLDSWTLPRFPLPDGRVRITVPVDHGSFRGHFDGQPVLPGVVLLQQLALAEARRRFPHLTRLERVSRVKFKRVVSPGESLELTLRERGAHVVMFELATNGEPTASGVLHFVPEKSDE
jgi:acyl-coenzyme A synthetase/AMP-(fatty) acid ligase